VKQYKTVIVDRGAIFQLAEIETPLKKLVVEVYRVLIFGNIYRNLSSFLHKPDIHTLLMV
jgi:hypothetical protein